MRDEALVEWLERREEAWQWLVEFPRSHRETQGEERRAYDEQSKAFCVAEDAILAELRRRGEPFVHRGQQFSAAATGLLIGTPIEDDKQAPSAAKGGAA
jgi:hypothetical protein